MKTSLVWDHSKKEWGDTVKGSSEDMELAKTVEMFLFAISKYLGVTNDGDIVVKTFFAVLSLLGIVGTIESACGISSSQIAEKLIDNAPNSLVLLDNLEIMLSLADESFGSDKDLVLKVGTRNDG